MADEDKCHGAPLPKLLLLPFLTDFFVDIELKKQAFVNNHPDVTEAELEDLIEGKKAVRKPLKTSWFWSRYAAERCALPYF